MIGNTPWGWGRSLLHYLEGILIVPAETFYLVKNVRSQKVHSAAKWGLGGKPEQSD